MRENRATNAASTFLSDRPSEQGSKFADSLRLTHFELESAFYTIGKPKMSSFKCHKWHSILTSVQRDMFDQRDTVQAASTHFPGLFTFRNFKFCSTNSNNFW